MKTLGALVLASVSAALLAGCGNGVSSSTPVAAESGFAAGRSWPHPGTTSSLYVANSGNNTVTVYASVGHTLLRTIADGVDDPRALEFDGLGKLFVANHDTPGVDKREGAVTVYQRATKKLVRTISKGIGKPVALAFDSAGNLYVADNRAVTEYAPGKVVVLRRIHVRLATALAFDNLGNLYVANEFHGGSVIVYGPGSTSPMRTITQEICAPQALAFDSPGNLYVANGGTGCLNQPGNGSVTVYAPGSTTVLRALSYVYFPTALAFDASGNLYVGNRDDSHQNGFVTVFAPGATEASSEITQGIALPLALAFDSSGNLYVANYINSSVTVYDPGSTSVSETISQSISLPMALAFGP